MRYPNMKLQILAYFASVFLVIPSVEAKKVEVYQAFSVAQQVMEQQSTLRSAFALELAYTATASSLRASDFSRAEVYYYVFNVTNDTGFVIVSGEDVCTPVIAYSTSGSFDPDRLPDNFIAWMEGICRNMDYALENNLEPSRKTTAEWEAYLNGTPILRNQTAVEPLVKTQWSQSSPYNNLCPQYKSQQTYTGCVATTMAQIMKYYQYPSSGQGTRPAYTTKTNKISIPALNFSTVTYDYGQMLGSYKTSPSQPAIDAVATLMYHCGVAVGMDYGIPSEGGSGASLLGAVRAFRTYFRYDPSLQIEIRMYYEDEPWAEIIKNEMDAGRPVFYSGMNVNNEGHAFLIDGYDASGKFHFNWGWAGSADGYFALDAQDFIGDNRMATHIKPDAGGQETYRINLHEGESLTTTAGAEIKQGDQFTVSGQYYNSGCTNFSGKLEIVLTDGNTHYRLGGKSYTQQDPFPADAYYSNPLSIDCTVPSNVPVGKYQIRAMITKDGLESFVSAQLGYIDAIDVTVTPLSGMGSIRTTNSFTLYPNPVENECYIQLNENILVKELKIVDICGKTCKAMTVHSGGQQIRIPVGDLPAGMYVLILNTDVGVFFEKVIMK